MIVFGLEMTAVEEWEVTAYNAEKSAVQLRKYRTKGSECQKGARSAVVETSGGSRGHRKTVENCHRAWSPAWERSLAPVTLLPLLCAP